MWLTSLITKNTQKTGTPSLGSVTGAARGRVEVQAASQYRDVQAAVPYGIAYVPPIGLDAVVVPVDGAEVCVGVVMPQMQGLCPGELALFSAGGASIVLKNDGTVLINGTVYGGG